MGFGWLCCRLRKRTWTAPLDRVIVYADISQESKLVEYSVASNRRSVGIRSEAGFDRATSHIVSRLISLNGSTELYLSYLLVISIAVLKSQVNRFLCQHVAKPRIPLVFARHACQVPAYHGLPSRRPGSDVPRHPRSLQASTVSPRGFLIVMHEERSSVITSISKTNRQPDPAVDFENAERAGYSGLPARMSRSG